MKEKTPISHLCRDGSKIFLEKEYWGADDMGAVCWYITCPKCGVGKVVSERTLEVLSINGEVENISMLPSPKRSMDE